MTVDDHRLRLAIDTDGGVDDFLAIQLALAHCGVAVSAMTVSGGNVCLEKAARNVALAAVDVRGDYELAKIARGAVRPIRNEAFIGAPEWHSEEGLTLPRKELDWMKSRLGKVSGSAVDQIAKLLDAERRFTLVTIGPLTNIAQVIKVRGARLDLIDRVVIMGGGLGCGNVRAADQAKYAEFNIYNDPEAASIVFEAFSGRITLLPLGVCETVCLTQLDIKTLTASKRSHRLMRGWLAFRKRLKKTGRKLDFPLYDPVTVAVAINEKLVSRYDDQEIVVDTTDEVRRGETRIRPCGSKVRVVSELDVKTARAMIMETCFGSAS